MKNLGQISWAVLYMEKISVYERQKRFKDKFWEFAIPDSFWFSCTFIWALFSSLTTSFIKQLPTWDYVYLIQLWHQFLDTYTYYMSKCAYWRRKWQPTPVFLPGKFHGQRSLAGYSPWGCKELDMTEWLTTAKATTKCVYNGEHSYFF